MRRTFSRSTKPLRSGNPQEVRDASRGSLGSQRELQSELPRWTKAANGRLKFGRIFVRSAFHSQGVGARPWILERRNVLARGIYNRPGPPKFRFISEVQTSPKSDVLGWGALGLARWSPGRTRLTVSGGVAEGRIWHLRGIPRFRTNLRRSTLRMMASGAALKEVANSRLRRLWGEQQVL